ncbi:hypothetical protein [Oceanobacillus salinisoli]|uniref:hypothetical protein n=1 Tax=Oceanobacillus salinisoli TaxID=2678611 RepID=UPI0012E2935C|nr:hypothetical protein [Oceanobacillus salinisoli]
MEQETMLKEILNAFKLYSDKIDQKLDNMNSDLESQINNLETKLGGRISSLEARIGNLEQKWMKVSQMLMSN